MSDLQRPGADWELQFMIAGCAEKGLPIEIVGSGSKRAVGRPVEGAVTITTASLRGVTLYEPSELVMSARAGTPLTAIEAELAARGQMLAFEPIDVGPATGASHGTQTIGAVFATNLSGARRIHSGAARDHLLGVKGVNGRAELFKSGGRVMKNVTGYDVARGLTGSWGTLAVLTEVTFKVVPWPETAVTVVYLNLPDNLAVELLSAAMAQPVEVSGAVHLQAPLAARISHPGLKTMGKSVTALRLENFSGAVDGPQAEAQGSLEGLRQGARARSPRDARVLGRAAPPVRAAEPADAALAHLDQADSGCQTRRRDQALHAGGSVLRLGGRSRLARGAGDGRCRNRRDPPRRRHARRACYLDPRRTQRACRGRGVPAA